MKENARRPRIVLFGDGMNFYLGQTEARVRMRLDEMARVIAEQYGGDLVRFRYYTSPMPSLSEDARRSQQRFYRALQHIPALDLIFGRHDPRINPDGRTVHAEKETDVRMSIDMALGAAKDQYDIAVVITADTDFVPAIEAVRAEGKRAVWAHFPHQRGVVRLYKAAGEDFEFTPAFCERCALPARDPAIQSSPEPRAGSIRHG